MLSLITMAFGCVLLTGTLAAPPPEVVVALKNDAGLTHLDTKGNNTVQFLDVVFRLLDSDDVVAVESQDAALHSGNYITSIP